jgi:DNA-binding NarL/FixJ family response regulator
MARGSGGCGPILIVDEEKSARALISRVFNKAGYATHEARSGEEALEAARRDRPAVVVLEVCLPDVCGYEVCRRLREEFGDGLPIVFVSGTRTESFDRVGGLLIGADDYLAKPFAMDELLTRTRRLIRQETPLPSGVASRLSRREQEVLRLLAEGLGKAEIADRLVISRNTVGTHIEHIFGKLGVHTRGQAVARAYRYELIGARAAQSHEPQSA